MWFIPNDPYEIIFGIAILIGFVSWGIYQIFKK